LAKQTINIGAAPNDGTGDPIRDAFSKVNDNFTEIYTSYVASGGATVGNSTVNTVISNTGGLVVSNSTVNTVANSSVIKIGNSTANATMTSTQVSVFGNTSIGNTTINTTALAIGNSSANSLLSQTQLNINASATIGSALVNTTAFYLGNSTVNWTANNSRITIKQANVTSNSFSLGSYYAGVTNFANGYTVLPNGLLMQWGYIAAVNSTANLTTFSSVGGVAFTNIFSVSVTSTTANHVFVSSANSTALILQCNTTANTGAYWSAIGK